MAGEMSVETCSILNKILVDEINYNTRQSHEHMEELYDDDSFAVDFHRGEIDKARKKVISYERALQELRGCGCDVSLK